MHTARPQKTSNIAALGLAMFSMFFGSGNIIFPIVVGQLSKNEVLFGIAGLIVTAVFVPFLGLLALSLFDGDYLKFFSRMGAIPGWIITVLIMGLIGPLGVLPRCIVISYASMTPLLPELSLPQFSLVSCAVIFLCTFKRHKIIGILGLLLTPALLCALLFVIAQGLLSAGAAPQADFGSVAAFLLGLSEGYNTMDLFAAFMFASVVLSSIKKSQPLIVAQPQKLTALYLKASLLGLGFLAAIYVGMSFIAAKHSLRLTGVPSDRLLQVLAFEVLGPHAGLVVSVAISLACLTTAITLALVFSEFISQTVSKNRLHYKLVLALTLAVAFVVSTLEFTGIQAILVPALQYSLPSLMVLTAVNLAHKYVGFSPVKPLVFLTFIATLFYYHYF